MNNGGEVSPQSFRRGAYERVAFDGDFFQVVELTIDGEGLVRRCIFIEGLQTAHLDATHVAFGFVEQNDERAFEVVMRRVVDEFEVVFLDELFALKRASSFDEGAGFRARKRVSKAELECHFTAFELDVVGVQLGFIESTRLEDDARETVLTFYFAQIHRLVDLTARVVFAVQFESDFRVSGERLFERQLQTARLGVAKGLGRTNGVVRRSVELVA